jgi:hypothetical protein
VQLTAGPAGDPDATFTKPTPEPWDPGWLLRRGLRPVRCRPGPDRNGKFEVEVPAVRGMVILAELPGCRPARAFLEFTPGADFADRISLDLDRAPIVRGIVRTQLGLKGTKARVTVWVAETTRLDRFQPARLPFSGHKYWLEVGQEEAMVTYEASGETDRNGEYEIPVHVEGEAIVLAEPGKTLAPATERIRLGGSNARVDLKVGRLSSSMLASVYRDGKRIRSGRVKVLEAKRGDAPMFVLDLDRSGRLYTGLFEKKRTYELRVFDTKPEGPPGSVVLRWDRKRRIELIAAGLELRK